MDREKKTGSSSGFFENVFTLPPHPETGMWTARAFYMGQFETESRALFEVQEYVLPTFGVTVQVDFPFILQDTPGILVTVKAKYVNGMWVEGNARLTLYLKDESGVSEYILYIDRAQLERVYFDYKTLKEFFINVKDILESPLLRDRDFPAGCRLEIVATVLESATGTEETTSYDGTIFADKPYTFKFSRSKLNFRPGLEYYLKVDMIYANGQPATGYDIRANMFKNGVFDDSVVQTTDNKGHALFIFFTSFEADTISFTAETTDNRRQKSESFVVEAHLGENQIQVEHVIDGEYKNMIALMRASTNIQGSSSTGMLFMVVTRGKVVYVKFKESANQASEIVTEELQEMISPSSRLLVFYVHKGTNVLVADSVKFDVDKKCRGKGLELQTDRVYVKPPFEATLSISGDSLMWVGLNVMDKALLLLNNKNLMRKNKMFEALESHDLGCGEGSGRSSADVFKKTGLTVLTNAVIDGQELERKAYDCQGNRRRRRESDECLSGTHESCCAYGIHYANEVVYEEDHLVGIDLYTKCYAKARDFLKKNLPMKCVVAFFLSCKYKEYTGMIKSFDDVSDYLSDLVRIAESEFKPRIRSAFPESWFFEIDRLDDNGNMKKVISYPDSMTEWMIQAIGITPDQGMCIADPVDVKAFNGLFIQLDLPYKATLEHFNVKATIFYYGLPVEDPITANIYLEGVEHLCYNTESGKPSPKTVVTLKPGSAGTVRFSIIPLKHGTFPITVSAIVTDRVIPEVDVIRKALYVVNEGIEEQMTIQICLDPSNQMKDCKNDELVISDVSDSENAWRVYTVDLTLPKKSIAGSGSATAYIQHNIMDNVVKAIFERVDSLFQQPMGHGEQTMIGLAPTVYAMMFVKEHKIMTADIEIKGNQWIRDGVTKQVSQYRKPDGSYAAWQNRQSSTWLTAFVAKVFCQAQEVVDDAVDKENDIVSTINWLMNHVTDNGEFIDHMPVIHREMIGQVKNERDPSLTAFVLVTLLECDIWTEDLNKTINKSTAFLEKLNVDMLKNNPYLLAISTYALAMAKSEMKWVFKDLLHKTQNSKEDVYWGNAGGKPASAQAVESTAYALLAMLELRDFETSTQIAKWLTSQLNAQGSFRTTQDTVVGLQALFEYSILYKSIHGSSDVNLIVELYANDWTGPAFELTRENAAVQQIAKNLPVEHNDNKLMVRVTGTGKGRMIIDFRYNRPAEEEKVCPFVISKIEVNAVEDIPIELDLAKERNCDICGRCEQDPTPPKDCPLGAFDPAEADPKMQSNFGRRKKQANRKVRVTSTKICIRFSVSSKSDKEFGMSIVNFGLETGVGVVKDDLDKLVADNPNIALYEMPSNGKGFVVFYLQQITSKETHFTFRLKDDFESNAKTRQPSSVKVYDNYNPDQSCTQFYGTRLNRGKIDYECDKNNQQCHCLQTMCIQKTEEDIMSKKKPALWLHRYSCNPENANYAVLVTIKSVIYDIHTEQVTARGIVKDSMNKGIEQLDVDDAMTFFWSLRCNQPDLEKGSSYYIIGRDGNKFWGDDWDQEYRYPLMGSAVVIKERDEYNEYNERKEYLALQMYKKLMKGLQCHG